MKGLETEAFKVQNKKISQFKLIFTFSYFILEIGEMFFNALKLVANTMTMVK